MSEVITNWVLFDATADKQYIKKMMPEGVLAFFDSEEDAKRAKASNKGTDYKRIDRVKASDYDQLKAKLDEARGLLTAINLSERRGGLDWSNLIAGWLERNKA